MRASASSEGVIRRSNRSGHLGPPPMSDLCVGEGKMLEKFRKKGMRVVGVELVEERARRAAGRLCGALP